MKKRKTIIMLTASSWAIAASTVASGQTTGALNTNSDTQDIIVTGVRGSLRSAQQAKRTSPVVIEAITGEDLGKFTDTSIADALQRVPGLNIQRPPGTFDSGYGVTIRGLSGAFSNSTLNGRNLLGIPGFGGAGGRQFDFQTVPPEILSGIVVYKTSAASQYEPGLAGQIDLRTLRPLDYRPASGRKTFGSVELTGGKTTSADRFNSRIGGSFGTKLFDGTLGIFVAGLYSDDYARNDQIQTYASSVNFTLDNGTAIQNGQAPKFGWDIWKTNEKRGKRSVAADLQWRPNKNFEINLDVLFNKSDIVRRDQTDYYSPAIGLGGFGSQIVPASAVTLGGRTGLGLIGFDSSKIPGLVNFGYSTLGALHLDYKNANFNTGVNGSWRSDNDRTKITADYSYGSVDYTLSWIHPYIDNSPTTRQLDTVTTGRDSLNIAINQGVGSLDSSDPTGYTGLNAYEYFQKRYLARRHQARLDFTQELGEHFILRAGGRYENTHSSFVSMVTGTVPTSVAGAFTGNTLQLPFHSFRTPEVDFNGFCASNQAFCNQNNLGKGSLVGSFPTSINGKPGDILQVEPNYSYEIKEATTAAYGQLDYDGHVFGLGLSGNVGLRAVHVSEDAKAFQGQCTKIYTSANPCVPGSDTFQLVSDKNSYWEYLPSANLSVKPTENTAIRLGAGRTMTLASLQQLAPIGNVTVFLPIGSLPPTTPNLASSGNTHLRPTTAWNYDITAEYYTPNKGSIILSVFYKDVKNLVASTTIQNATVPGQGNTLFDVTSSQSLTHNHLH